MNKYVKEFLLRGMIFGGFGPIILAIIYFIVEKLHPETTFNGTEFLLGTVSVYLLAFVHAGASVFNQIEAWGINKSIGWHFGVLYAAYSICYLINTWIPFDLKIFGIFTGIFIAVYAIVWITVYICVKHTVKKTNEQLRKTI